MKGIELPINILVVVAVAVIVLLGVIALYFSGFIRPAGVMNQESAKSSYCAIIMRSPGGCAGTILLSSVGITDFDADRDTFMGAADTGSGWDDTWATIPCGGAVGDAGDNLAALLACYFGVTSERDGLKTCGCAI